VTLRYFALGLLAQQPMSGYDMKQFLENLDWLISTPSFGSLYPNLHALLKDELVTVNVMRNGDNPPRKVYSITDAGHEALQDWINEPFDPDASLRGFLMRLMLANNLSRADLIDCLQQRRSQVAAHQLQLKEEKFSIDNEEDDSSALSKSLAHEYGLAVAKAELAWLDRKLQELSSTTRH